MLISDYVIQKWNPKNKKRFEQFGYKYEGMGKPFIVSTNHLSDGSIVKVDVLCDYCGKLYQKEWHNYLLENKKSHIHKDCCYTCKGMKIMETTMSKYNVTSVFLLDDVKEKIRQTNIVRYGSDNPFSSDDIKRKIKDTCIRKYGVDSPMKNDDVRRKAENTCEKKYGTGCVLRRYNGTGENSPRWKGGVLYHRKERSTHEYVTWRNSVFARDNYTCICCQRGNDHGIHTVINAHHIKNWKDYPELRYSTENGATFCFDCHTLFHRIYGKSNNNEDQLSEFLCNHGKKIC